MGNDSGRPILTLYEDDADEDEPATQLDTFVKQHYSKHHRYHRFGCSNYAYVAPPDLIQSPDEAEIGIQIRVQELSSPVNAEIG